MFPEHWKLTENPFRVSPDASHFFFTSSGRAAHRQLLAALSADADLVLLTGAAGAGKTVLLRQLQRDLEAQSRRVFLAYRASENLADLLSRCCVELDIALPAEDGPPAVEVMAERIAAAGGDGRVILLVDEAEHLADETLTDLVRLSTRPPVDKGVAQFVLVGMPDIAARLDALTGEEVAGASLPHAVLAPIAPDEIRPFIDHHLALAGYEGPELFGDDACEAIMQRAGGSFRLVAQLAGHALLFAGLARAERVTAGNVAQAMQDTLLPVADDPVPAPVAENRPRLIDLVDLNPSSSLSPPKTEPVPAARAEAAAEPSPARAVTIRTRTPPPARPPRRRRDVETPPRTAWLPRLLPPLRPGHVMLGLIIGIGATAVGADLDRADRHDSVVMAPVARVMDPAPPSVPELALASPAVSESALAPLAPIRPDADLRAAALDAEQDTNFAAAADRYRAVYDRQPSDLNALLGLARSLRHLERPDEARGLVETALTDLGDKPPLLIELAKVELDDGASTRAIQVLERAAERAPEDWQIFTLLGAAYDSLSQRPDAANSYRQALRLAPDNPVVLNNYALSLARSGRLDGAVALLSRAADQPDATELVTDNLTIVRAMQDQQASTEASLRRSLTDSAAADPAPGIGATRAMPMAPPPRPVAPLILANSVDDAPAQAEEPRLADAAPSQVVVAQAVVPPELQVTAGAGVEDQPLPLDIALPSATPATPVIVEIAGLPAGATLSAGNATDDGAWRLSAGDLAGLLLIPPADFSGAVELEVTARAGADDADAPATTRPLRAEFAARADDPILAVTPVGTVEDQAGALAITADVADADGSERLTVTVAGLPEGATLSAGKEIGGGRWRLSADQLADLALVPPPSFAGVFELAIAATAIEADGDSATIADIVQVKVTGVPDVPILVAEDATGAEDEAVPLIISLSSADPDGSESLTLAVAGLPDGAALSAGQAGDDGRWRLSLEDLDNLQLTPPADLSGTFALDLTAVASEAGLDASATARVEVALAGVADPPVLTADALAGQEDSAIPLDLAVAAADTDGSESLSVALAGLPAGATLSAGQDDGDGRWRLAASDLANLRLTPPPDFSGRIELSLSATATERDGDTANTDGAITVDVAAVADAPVLTLKDADGAEDAPLPVAIAVASADADGSETLADVVLEGVPDGARLSAGDDEGEGRWRLDAGALDGLTLTPPSNFSGAFELAVNATAREADGDAAVSVGIVRVRVAGVADMPRLVLTDVVGLEDQPIPLEITAEPADTDGSEKLSAVILDGVPADAGLSAGQDEGDGRWRLAEADLADLALTPPPNRSGLIELSVTATADESDGDSATATGVVRVAMNPVADAPVLSAETATGVEDEAVPLAIAATLADDDGSERLSLTVAGLPGDARLSAGKADADGRWRLSADDLANLTLTPPADFSGRLDLSITATATEADDSSAETVAEVGIDIRGAADAPRLTVADAVGREGSATPLAIDAGLADTDGSEQLSIEIAGLPDGARPSAGSDQGDGRWRLSADDLDGLALTLPEHMSGVFALSVTALATEADGDTATTVVDAVPLRIAAIADPPSLSIGTAAATADGAIGLPIEAALIDDDGSERLSLTVSGLPAGAILSAGRAAGEGRWRLAAADLANLVLTPPAGLSDPFELTVAAAATERNGADVAVSWASVTVDAPPPVEEPKAEPQVAQKPAPARQAAPARPPEPTPPEDLEALANLDEATTTEPPAPKESDPLEVAEQATPTAVTTEQNPSPSAVETSEPAQDGPLNAATVTAGQEERTPLPPRTDDARPTVAMSTSPALLGAANAAAEKAPDLSGGSQSSQLLIARMMERGDKLMREGDVAGARLLFEFAAKRGSAKGATAFAKSHDPSYLDRVGIRGPSTNAERAFEWYTIGAERGDLDATTQIELLKTWLREQAGEKVQ